MKKRGLKPEEIKSILLIRPHFISIEDILRLAKELKQHYPFAKITFTGNKIHLTENDISALKSTQEISEIVVYDKEKLSQFQYIHLLRQERFYLSVIPFISPLGYANKKMKIIACLSSPKILLYDLEKQPEKFSHRFIIIEKSIWGCMLIIKGLLLKIVKENIIILLIPFVALIMVVFFFVFLISGNYRKLLRRIPR